MPRNYKKITLPQISADHTISKHATTPDFHLHSNYEVYVFLQGNVNYFVEQNCYQLVRGNVLVFNNQEIHSVSNLINNTYERLVLHFNPQIVKPFCSTQTNILDCFTNHPPGVNNLAFLDETKLSEYKKLFNTIKESIHNNSYGADALLSASLIQLLVMINKAYQNNTFTGLGILPHRIKPIMNYIDTHITEDLSLDKIANALSLDKFYLSHLFKKETGSTLFQYIIVKRVALAKQYLLQGKSVTEACDASGFNDYSNFIRTFKKVSGIPPGQYRNKYQ